MLLSPASFCSGWNCISYPRLGGDGATITCRSGPGIAPTLNLQMFLRADQPKQPNSGCKMHLHVEKPFVMRAKYPDRLCLQEFCGSWRTSLHELASKLTDIWSAPRAEDEQPSDEPVVNLVRSDIRNASLCTGMDPACTPVEGVCWLCHAVVPIPLHEQHLEQGQPTCEICTVRSGSFVCNSRLGAFVP